MKRFRHFDLARILAPGSLVCVILAGCEPTLADPDEEPPDDPFFEDFEDDSDFDDDSFEPEVIDFPQVCRLATPAAESTISEVDTDSDGSPSWIELPPRQLLAVGFVRVNGLPCSGTLIAPGWVITAKHCIDFFEDGEVLDPALGGLEFLTGVDPNLPDRRIVARVVHHHPDDEIDLSLIELGIPREGSLPDLTPILLSRETELVEGAPAEAAGFGIQDDGRTGRRHFITEEVSAWTDITIDVQSTASDGLCFGDSGGPLLMRGADREPRLVGTLWKGSSDCSGLDRFVRVDAHIDWIEDVIGSLPTQCTDNSTQTSCDGSYLTACADNVRRQVDCRQCDLRCREDDQGAHCAFEAPVEEAPDAGPPTPEPEVGDSTDGGVDGGVPPEDGGTSEPVLQSEAVAHGIELHSLVDTFEATESGLPLSFRLINTGTESLQLGDIAIRYYFSNDSGAAASFECALAEGLGCGVVNAQFVTEAEGGAASEQDFVELTFDTGATLGVGAAMLIDGVVQFASDEMPIQSNDFSFLAVDSYTRNPNIVVLRSGQLAWGAPPTTVVVQAETGVPIGVAVIATNHAGFTGSGLISFIISPGSGVVNLTVDAANAGTAELFIRYAQGRERIPIARLGVLVDGVRQTTAEFINTGSWTRWSTTSVRLDLVEGDNRIDFMFEEGDTGYANLDYVWLGALPAPE